MSVLEIVGYSIGPLLLVASFVSVLRFRMRSRICFECGRLYIPGHGACAHSGSAYGSDPSPKAR
jgi:hypothetical protein